MPNDHKPRLFHKLVLLTGSLGTLFIVLFWLVMLIAEDQIELISLRHWLDSEANLYEQDYRRLGGHPNPPNHYEFDFYASASGVPEWLGSYQSPGFYEHHLGSEDKHFLVRPDPSGSGLYYIVFKDDADDYLDDYEDTLHKVTFGIGVTITMLMFFYGFYLVRQIALPLQRVTGKIRQMTPDSPPFKADAKYDELYGIEKALLDSRQKIDNYFRREQEFSHFAAHEIRTPLMVLQGSTELLEQIGNENRHSQNAVARIRTATNDISLLTDAFLLLGKEEIDAHYFSNVNLASLLKQEVEKIASIYAMPADGYRLDIDAEPVVTAPSSFMIIMVSNIIKNAFGYTDGIVTIHLSDSCLTVSNPYRKDHKKSRGFGYGLVIISRICDRLHWPLESQDSSSDFYISIRFRKA